jgi:alpha,alpha-trehalase
MGLTRRSRGRSGLEGSSAAVLRVNIVAAFVLTHLRWLLRTLVFLSILSPCTLIHGQGVPSSPVHGLVVPRTLLHGQGVPSTPVPGHVVSRTPLPGHVGPRTFHVATDRLTTDLLENEDTDGDRKITVHDPFIRGTDRGDKSIWFTTIEGERCQVAGTAFLANLLQELTLLKEQGLDSAWLRSDRIFELPADRVSRSIRELYWSGLTRTVDEAGLPRLIADEKTSSADGFRYVYVPSSDALARTYFTSVSARHPEWKLQVRTIPPHTDSAFVQSLDGRHGVLSLSLRHAADGRIQGVPFVVPGGRFNEMYGWDTYFIILGLLQDGRVELAQGMVDNLVYEVNNYGAILNANRSYYITRSQPPFLTSAALACYSKMPKTLQSKEWLRGVFDAAIREYHQVWMNKNRLLAIGLNRYFDSGSGVPPEVEPGHFAVIFQLYATELNTDIRSFEASYRKGLLHNPQLDTFFVHDRAMRESGHDTSYRLLGICADLATVDLNSLLFKIEMDVAATIRRVFGDALRLRDGSVERSAAWMLRAESRRSLMYRYLWNQERGMFFDYNVATRSQTGYVSATTLWPLWAGLASVDQARAVVQNALPLLEAPGGIAASTEDSRGAITPEHPQRQWDYPFGWAPHQMLAWQGLLDYGYSPESQRLVYKWLYTIAFNAANYNGTVPEKFDVVTRSHEVYAEYGNVGTKFEYITREGFGWTNASFQVGLGLLRPSLRDTLNRLFPPESIAE